MDEFELDENFDVSEDTSEEQVEETTETAPPVATKEDLEALRKLIEAQSQPAQPTEEDDDDRYTPVTRADLKAFAEGIAGIIKPIQETTRKAAKANIAAEHGLTTEAFDKLTAGLSPEGVEYFVGTPAFKFAAELAAKSSAPRVTAPRAANTNGSPSKPGKSEEDRYIAELLAGIKF